MISIEGQLPQQIKMDTLNKLFTSTREKLGRTEPSQVGLKFINEDEMAKLAANYAEKPGATDVLSFESPTPEGGDLGDIAICIAVAERQAKEHRVTLQQELSLLFVHGLLHLFGLDHATLEGSARMEELQNEILSDSRIAPRRYL